MDRIYIETTDNSEQIPNNLLAIMLRKSHHLNPDFTNDYSRVVRWYLEIVQGSVLREIGLDQNGNPVIIGPIGRNDGVWGGVPGTVDSRSGRPINPVLFEQLWQRMSDQLAHQIPSKIIEPVRPVDSASAILGLWTTGSGYSMSEDMIAFLPSGEGFFEVVNVVLNCYDTFRWQVPRPGSLSIEGIRCFYMEERPNVIEANSLLQLEDVRAELETKHYGDGSSVEFLYLNPAGDKTVENLYFPRTYYRCPVPVDKIVFPEFPQQ